MHKETLQRLVQARDNNQPVLLVSHLDSGEQTLYYLDDTTFGSALTDEQKKMAREALRSDRCQLYEEQLFFHPFNPPLRMIIVGAVHIAQSLVTFASLCRYQVTVVDPRQAFASDSRFPEVVVVTEWPDKALDNLQPDHRTAVVTLTHDPKLDDPALIVALRSEAFYIGALGSRKTQLARQKRLTEHGFSMQEQTRIHGPIGLNIGAKSPAEIAVAIMAQVTNSLRNTD